MTSQYLMHCVLRKTIVLRHQFQRGVIWIQKTTTRGDLGHRITLCDINSFKSDNIDGYIIKRKRSISMGLVINITGLKRSIT